MKKREMLSTDHVRGLHKNQDVGFNELSGAFKFLGPIIGNLSYMSSAILNTDLSEGHFNGGLLAFYNPSATTAWLTISVSGSNPPAPSSANGIALRPNDYTILAMPDGATKISSSDAAVVSYIINDYTRIG